MPFSKSCFYGQESIDVRALSLPVDLQAEFSYDWQCAFMEWKTERIWLIAGG